MSQTGRITVTVSMGGQAFSGNTSRDGEGCLTQVVTLPAGSAGAISASGVDGLVTGHGIAGSSVIDVHWSDPSDGSHKCRRGITVDGTATNAITFDETPEGEGDALPSEDTAVVVSVQVPIVSAFDGDQLMIIAAKSGTRSIVDFRTSSASALAQKLVAGETFSWATDQGVTNPMAGDDIASMVATNGETTATTLYISMLLNSVA